jgi:hypothetical protein
LPKSLVRSKALSAFGKAAIASLAFLLLLSGEPGLEGRFLSSGLRQLSQTSLLTQAEKPNLVND